MDFLRKLKKQPSINPQLASFAILCTQFQLLYILLINQEIPLYSEIFSLLRFDSSQKIQVIVLTHFILNVATLVYAVIKGIFFPLRKSAFDSLFLKFLKIKPNLLFVLLLDWNFAAYALCPLFLAAISSFNIVFMLLEIVVFGIVNVSYRFQEQDFICRKNNNMTHYLILIPIVALLNYQDSLYSAVLIVIRSIIQLYFNALSLQNSVIQLNNYFAPLLLLSFGIIDIFYSVVGYNILRNSHVSHLIIIFFLTITSAHLLAKSLVRTVPKYQLKRSIWFSKNQSNSSNALPGTQSGTQINEIEQQSFILSLRILVMIYFSKQKYCNSPHKRLNHAQLQEFDHWWVEYNQLIINHRVYCNNVNCVCQKLKIRSHENDGVSQSIVFEILFNSLSKILTLKPPNISKLLIIQKYFYIELLQKPIKSYYELMKLKNIVKKKEQILQVESLILQARLLFKNLFIKEKVQNQNLAIHEVLDFQNGLKDMKKRFIELSINYKKFYDIFGSIYVQINFLKQATADLKFKKDQFTKRLQDNMDKFSRNIEFLSFSYVYYNYFEEYSANLPKVEKKIMIIQELKHNLALMGNKNLGKNHVDVFDPTYGAIKIDLVQRPGEIQSITKNLCQLLGFNRDQVQGHKINKIMPYIFARFHDRFLKHFIQKGSIVAMKKKQRIFFAKNAKKFVFPITVRLKVQYFSSQGFYASSLIKKTPTKSEYILANNYGKIEEVSQKLYALLFQKGFREETSKVKRMNIYKMLLSLNHFVKNPTQSDDRIYEGIITTTQDQNSFINYFKYIEYTLRFNKKTQNTSKNEGTEGNSMNYAGSNRTEEKTNRSNSSLVTGSQSVNNSSFLDNSQIVQPDYDSDKCCNDMKESIKDYFKKVKLQNIKAFKVAYKFYDLVTPQFKCKVLEIVSIKQELSDNLMRVEVSKEMVEIGELYGLPEEDLHKFKQNQNQLTGIHPSGWKINIAKGCMSLFNYPIDEESTHRSCNSLVTGQEKITEPGVQQMVSVTSSLTSNTQSSQRKSSIINSFEMKTSINETLETFLTVLILLAALSLVIICAFSTTLKPDYQTLQHDNIIISNFKNDFQFRLAVQELYHFYHPFGFEPPEFLITKKHILTDSMKIQLKNSVKWIKDELSDDLYFDQMTLTHVDSGFQEKRPVLSTLGQIYSMFLMTEEQGQHLSDNYLTIRGHLENLWVQEVDVAVKHSYDLKIKIHLVVAFYGASLVMLFVILVLINRQSKMKEQKIVDFLPFIDIKQVMGKIQFYGRLTDCLKENQQISIRQINKIAESTEPLLKRSREKGSNLSLKKGSAGLSRRNLLVEQQKTQVKKQSGSKFIRILKDNQKTVNIKSMLLMVLLGCICLVVVFETEYFFIQAHQKFKAYIDLKQQAMFIQSIPSRLILIYLINTDKVIHNEEMVAFPQQFFTEADLGKFGLRSKLSKSGIHGTQLAQNLNQHFSTRMCSLVECNDSSAPVHDQNTEFLIYRFINAFHYMQMIKNDLPQSDQPKQLIAQWVRQGNVLKVLNGLEQVLDLMKKNYEDITNLFTGQINRVANNLLITSVTLIPLLIISFLMMRNRFLRFSYERIYSVQNIYKQLSWDILADNRYAINYFQNKLKHAKNV